MSYRTLAPTFWLAFAGSHHTALSQRSRQARSGRHPTSANAGSISQRNKGRTRRTRPWVYTPQQSQTDSADRQRRDRQRRAAALEMETMQLLLIAAAVAAACGALFVAWAATSDSREARVYRRKWKEFRLKNSKRNTSKYRGVGAGGGMHAASGGRGLQLNVRDTPSTRRPRRRERARQARRLA